MTTEESPTPSGLHRVSGPRRFSVLYRYLPILAIGAVQLLLVGVLPSRPPGLAGTSTTSGVGGGASLSPGVSSGSGPSAQASAGAGSASGISGGQGGAQGSTGGASGPAQQVDALGRPLTGDRSRCAPGGLVQEKVTGLAIPCIPTLVGPNAGATYRGVTANAVTVVYYMPQENQATQQLEAQAGLAATDAQLQEALVAYQRFFNQHYNFYGRTVKFVLYQGQCGSPTCWPAEAKALVQQLHPFYVATQLVNDVSFFTELTSLGVLNTGAQVNGDDAYYKASAPFAWDVQPGGDFVGRMTADYYCQILHGKTASYAGDATLKTKTRKLGVLYQDFAAVTQGVKTFASMISGGECGDSSTQPELYAYNPNDSSQVAQQTATAITEMRQTGVTTVVIWDFGALVLGTNAEHSQGWYPENFFSGDNGNSADQVARLGAPDEMANAFGLDWLAPGQGANQEDQYKAMQDGGAPSDIVSCGGCWVPFLWLRLIAIQIQFAGPRLTPQTVEQATFGLPPLGGTANPRPWAGWQPSLYEIGWEFTPGKFTAWNDVMLVFWNNTVNPPDSSQPGTWMCLDHCARFTLGTIPRGEPKAQTGQPA